MFIARMFFARWCCSRTIVLPKGVFFDNKLLRSVLVSRQHKNESLEMGRGLINLV